MITKITEKITTTCIKSKCEKRDGIKCTAYPSPTAFVRQNNRFMCPMMPVEAQVTTGKKRVGQQKQKK